MNTNRMSARVIHTHIFLHITALHCGPYKMYQISWAMHGEGSKTSFGHIIWYKHVMYKSHFNWLYKSLPKTTKQKGIVHNTWLPLLKPPGTSMGSIILSLSCQLSCYSPLQSFVSRPEWLQWQRRVCERCVPMWDGSDWRELWNRWIAV